MYRFGIELLEDAPDVDHQVFLLYVEGQRPSGAQSGEALPDQAP